MHPDYPVHDDIPTTLMPRHAAGGGYGTIRADTCPFPEGSGPNPRFYGDDYVTDIFGTAPDGRSRPVFDDRTRLISKWIDDPALPEPAPERPLLAWRIACFFLCLMAVATALTVIAIDIRIAVIIWHP